MSGVEKIPYPKSIPFILTTEFCERFSYYGMRGSKIWLIKKKRALFILSHPGPLRQPSDRLLGDGLLGPVPRVHGPGLHHAYPGEEGLALAS